MAKIKDQDVDTFDDAAAPADAVDPVTPPAPVDFDMSADLQSQKNQVLNKIKALGKTGCAVSVKALADALNAENASITVTESSLAPALNELLKERSIGFGFHNVQ